MHAQPIAIDEPIPAFLTQPRRLKLVDPVVPAEPGELAICRQAAGEAVKIMAGGAKLLGLAVWASVRVLAFRTARQIEALTSGGIGSTGCVFMVGLAAGVSGPFLLT